VTPERYARVQELFLQACELNEKDREAFLAQQCADDDALRSEVESLLAHDNSQTLIRTSDETIVDLRPGMAVQPLRRSVTRRLQTIGLITKRLGPQGHLALGACVACIVLTLVGVVANHGIRTYQQTLREEALQEILDAKISGLEMWFEHQQDKIESWARSKELQRLAGELTQLASKTNGDWSEVRQSPLQEAIRLELHRLSQEDFDHAIWNRRSITIADSASAGQLVGGGVTPYGAGVLALAFEGQSRMLVYDHDQTIAKRSVEYIEPHLGVVVPLRDTQGQIIAALLVHDVDAREQAARILRMVRLGESGETYVFNKDGEMLSPSRFTEQLREIGLLPADGRPGVVQLRDPGGDMTVGYRPTEPLETLPLTKMARHATAGKDGVDVQGYRDYRGVLVVGAWQWLEEYGIGLATELDMSENAPGHWILVLETWVVFGLIAACLGIAVFSYYSIHRLRHQIGEHRRLGQYTLEHQIGEGGMGKVFRAKHAFLIRPTAIKLLKPELVDKQSIARFEREATLASQLTHPNTVEVFDFGVTPEGLFFCVMEHINGPSLQQLVERHGPLPPARVVYLLQQVCESLAEAHEAGMIHRDLKPQNIMACRRGGKADVVKVLDFGLAKRTHATESLALTASGMLAGTPLYIAPERLRDPSSANPRTDIYSLGAVGFFLLTGREVFLGDSVADLLFQVMNAEPPRPSTLQGSVPAQLDQLVVDCLAKDPQRRPGNVSEILQVLRGIEDLDPWGQAEAQRWWSDHMPNA
jgi:hypothetical protein